MIERRNQERLDNSRRPYRIVTIRSEIDEAMVLLVKGILEVKEYRYLDSDEARAVIDAIRRSTNELDDKSVLPEITDYVTSISEDGMQGFINNVKGIANEIIYVNEENSDGDAITAELAQDANNPGWDVKLTNHDSGEIEYVQLKATDSQSLIDAHIEKYPDIRVEQTSGDDLVRLSNQADGTVEYVHDGGETPADYIPTLAGITAGIECVPIVKAWLRKEISKEECIDMVVKRTGYKAAKVAALLLLLSTAVGPVITTFLIVKLFSLPFKMYDESRSENKRDQNDIF